MLSSTLDAGRPLADLNLVLGGGEFTPPSMEEALAPLREPLSDDPYAYLELSDPFAVRLLDDVAPPTGEVERPRVDLDAILSGDQHPGISAVAAAFSRPELPPASRPRRARARAASIALLAGAAVALGAGAAAWEQMRGHAAAAPSLADHVDAPAPADGRQLWTPRAPAKERVAPRVVVAAAPAPARGVSPRATRLSRADARPAPVAVVERSTQPGAPAGPTAAEATATPTAAPAPPAAERTTPAPAAQAPAADAPAANSGLKTPDWALDS